MIWINGQVLEIKRFPDGEVNIAGTNPLNCVGVSSGMTLTWKWESDSDLITLLLLKKRYPFLNTLNILFLPYSREDRDAEGGSNCSLRYIGEFVQSLGFGHINVVDPHSDLTLAYLGIKAHSSYPVVEFTQAIQGIEKPIIMFPDAGAQKRYGKLWGSFEHIVGHKTRDFYTGKITGYEVAGGEMVNLRNIVIVDDLCSYGGTFMAAGNELREHFDPRSITLLVTHCEYSIFKGSIFEPETPINRVITTDSIITEESSPVGPSALTVIELPKYLLF